MKRKLDDNDAPTVEVANGASEPGSSKEKSLSSFESFNLDTRLLQALSKSQFTTPFPVQSKAIPLALDGKDILAKSKTGSGKTLAYVLPTIQSILRRKSTTPKEKAIVVLVLVPSNELADQVTRSFVQYSEFCAKDIRALNLTQRVSDAVLTAKLQEYPDVVVSTPGRVIQMLASNALSLEKIEKLIIDEADLVLDYGHKDNVDSLSKLLPKGIQTFLMSATLTPEVDQLKILFCRDPVVVKIDEQEEKGQGVTQYTVKCGEEEKFLLIFVMFKLKLVKGKCIVFVEDVDRSYRLKLYLEQFGIKSCVLNAELPINSRLHAVQEFNKGLYSIMIAADDQEVLGGVVRQPKPQINEAEGSDEEDNEEEDTVEPEKVSSTKNLTKSSSTRKRDFGISRGIDFQHVACVLNFDFPHSSKSYTHRIGRTARAGQAGMALSFVIPRSEYGKHKPTSNPASRHDEKILAKVTARQEKKGNSLLPYQFKPKVLEGFRYRMNDALRAVTSSAVRDARTREIKTELLNSEKLRKHFEDNPDDLRALRHDHSGSAGVVRVQNHLKHVPSYLLPGGGTNKTGDGTEALVGFNDGAERRERKRARRNNGRKKGGVRKADPLKSFRGRNGKKN